MGAIRIMIYTFLICGGMQKTAAEASETSEPSLTTEARNTVEDQSATPATDTIETSLATDGTETPLSTDTAETPLATDTTETPLATDTAETPLPTDTAETSPATDTAESSLTTDKTETSLETNTTETSLATDTAEAGSETGTTETCQATELTETCQATETTGTSEDQPTPEISRTTVATKTTAKASDAKNIKSEMPKTKETTTTWKAVQATTMKKNAFGGKPTWSLVYNQHIEVYGMSLQTNISGNCSNFSQMQLYVGSSLANDDNTRWYDEFGQCDLICSSPSMFEGFSVDITCSNPIYGNAISIVGIKNLAEWKVFGNVSGAFPVNSLQRYQFTTAAESDVYASYELYNSPVNAFSPSTSFWSGSSPTPWWAVDLKEDYVVYEIRFYPEASYNANLEVRVGGNFSDVKDILWTEENALCSSNMRLLLHASFRIIRCRNNPPNSGRYLSLALVRGTQTLYFRYLQIFAFHPQEMKRLDTSSAIKIDLQNGNALQDSTYYDDSKYKAGNALSENPSLFSSTAAAEKNWWSVDLKGFYTVTSVSVKYPNHTNFCTNEDVSVHVGTVPPKIDDLAWLKFYDFCDDKFGRKEICEDMETFTCNHLPPPVGKYVAIRKSKGTAYKLSLQLVEVFGYKKSPVLNAKEKLQNAAANNQDRVVTRNCTGTKNPGYIDAALLSTLQVRSKLHCLTMCNTEPGCGFTVWKETTNTCYLHDGFNTARVTVPGDATVYECKHEAQFFSEP